MQIKIHPLSKRFIFLLLSCLFNLKRVCPQDIGETYKVHWMLFSPYRFVKGPIPTQRYAAQIHQLTFQTLLLFLVLRHTHECTQTHNHPISQSAMCARTNEISVAAVAACIAQMKLNAINARVFTDYFSAKGVVSFGVRNRNQMLCVYLYKRRARWSMSRGHFWERFETQRPWMTDFKWQ